MTGFNKYFHLEAFGKDDVKGITQGTIFIQCKLDGSNGSVFLGKDGTIRCGSRTRVLTTQGDNQGFCAFIEANKAIYEPLFTLLPNAILYGEWLVKHTINYYDKDAYKKFYVFDVALQKGEELEFLTPEQYEPVLDSLGILHVPTVAKLENYEGDFSEFTDKVRFLINGDGQAEGLVIKNYNFINRFGRMTFGKIVFKTFKETKKTIVTNQSTVEQDIAERFVTSHLVEKEYAKLIAAGVKNIQASLLGTVYKTMLEEEIWDILKKFKNPIIDFKALQKAVYNKVKELKKELF